MMGTKRHLKKQMSEGKKKHPFSRVGKKRGPIDLNTNWKDEVGRGLLCHFWMRGLREELVVTHLNMLEEEK